MKTIEQKSPSVAVVDNDRVAYVRQSMANQAVHEAIEEAMTLGHVPHYTLCALTMRHEPEHLDCALDGYAPVGPREDAALRALSASVTLMRSR